MKCWVKVMRIAVVGGKLFVLICNLKTSLSILIVFDDLSDPRIYTVDKEVPIDVFDSRSDKFGKRTFFSKLILV